MHQGSGSTMKNIIGEIAVSAEWLINTVTMMYMQDAKKIALARFVLSNMNRVNTPIRSL
jgi:hypothetical protein